MSRLLPFAEHFYAISESGKAGEERRGRRVRFVKRDMRPKFTTICHFHHRPRAKDAGARKKRRLSPSPCKTVQRSLDFFAWNFFPPCVIIYVKQKCQIMKISEVERLHLLYVKNLPSNSALNIFKREREREISIKRYILYIFSFRGSFLEYTRVTWSVCKWLLPSK